MRVLMFSLILPQIIISAVPPPTIQSQNSYKLNWSNYKNTNKLSKNYVKQEFLSIPTDSLG